MRSIYEGARRELKQDELWPGYFEYRYEEFRGYLKKFPKKHFSDVLEIGCGIGYQSALLACIADRVVATDYETPCHETHSPGLERTRNLLSRLGVKNVSVKGASAEALPFADESFDLVFSSHVLEHIPDRKKAVREINRVLKPGGFHICIVPTRVSRIYSLPLQYIYYFKRSAYHLLKYFSRPSGSPANSTAPAQQVQASVQLFRKHFPFPPPHGEFPSWWSEVIEWSPSRWLKLLQTNDSNLVEASTTELNPLLPLSGAISTRWAGKVIRFSSSLDSSLGRIPILRPFGINFVAVFEKKFS